jgi:hypothetical protein
MTRAAGERAVAVGRHTARDAVAAGFALGASAAAPETPSPKAATNAQTSQAATTSRGPSGLSGNRSRMTEIRPARLSSASELASLPLATQPDRLGTHRQYALCKPALVQKRGW